MKSSVLQYKPAEADNRRLANLCGAVDQNLRQLEEAYDVRIARRADTFAVEGAGPQTKQAVRALDHFYRRAEAPLSVEDIQLGLVELRAPAPAPRAAPAGDGAAAPADDAPVLHTRRSDLQGRTPRQREYLRNILSHDITFGIGPAGTGKTYLAVACAVDALERDAIKKIVLTRPAVEAGERL
ncbi:MAG TPA: PhoH family protein, partial [Burkholderiaceae bacterium]|nr:PhoH family protein [Burkholderiaceae bacterium]